MGSFPVPPFQIQFWKAYLTLSYCNEIGVVKFGVVEKSQKPLLHN